VFFVYNFSLLLITPIFIYIYLSPSCIIVSVFSQVVDRDICVIYPYIHFVYSPQRNKYLFLKKGYCLSDSEIVPLAPIITGITFSFTFHMP
jgi:hypothetical protein